MEVARAVVFLGSKCEMCESFRICHRGLSLSCLPKSLG